ncbi:MAG: hypothetical protein HWN81_04880 [Candidatus Lokiarchaeota archaeon]|nr:hypothetical protein [Candidatus Lokiarchaeota archaeon]
MMGTSKKKKVELMAPLKNYKSLNAVLGKTDAVYFGAYSQSNLLKKIRHQKQFQELQLLLNQHSLIMKIDLKLNKVVVIN